MSTSSSTSSAPWLDVSSRSSALKPGAGATTPMFAAAGSVMTAAISPPRVANRSATAEASL